MPSAVLKWSVIGTGTVIGVLLIAALSAWWIFRGPDIPYEALEQKYAGSASHFVDPVERVVGIYMTQITGFPGAFTLMDDFETAVMQALVE